MVLVIVNGAPCSGKTTFEAMCMKQHKKVRSFSTIDFVKELARECGWDGSKTADNRRFLSDFKDLLTKWGDVPFKQVERQIQLYESLLRNYDLPTDDAVVFIDCREPDEIQKFRERLGAVTLFIYKPDNDTEISNHADAEVANYEYDYYIANDGDLDALRAKSIQFLKDIKVEK